MQKGKLNLSAMGKYPVIPKSDRTKKLYERIIERFDEMRREEKSENEMRAKFIVNKYYYERLSLEFEIKPDYIARICISRTSR